MIDVAARVRYYRGAYPDKDDAWIAARMMVAWQVVACVPRGNAAVSTLPACVSDRAPDDTLDERQAAPSERASAAPAVRNGGRVRRQRADRPSRRFEEHHAATGSTVPLPENHPAVVDGRTIFPTTVIEPLAADRVLVGGANSRKIGDRVVKGPWKRMPIYTLTLEERATCPRSCRRWRDCYGSAMPFARRHAAGPGLEMALDTELRALADAHPEGFVVRAHVLGDFYSVEYAKAWVMWLDGIPALHLFGYTAWPEESDIGDVIQTLNIVFAERCAVRFSSDAPGPMRAVTIGRQPERNMVAEGIVCPAQTGATECCGTCGLCWSPAMREKSIAFILHGRKRRGEKARGEVEASACVRRQSQKPLRTDAHEPHAGRLAGRVACDGEPDRPAPPVVSGSRDTTLRLVPSEAENGDRGGCDRDRPKTNGGVGAALAGEVLSGRIVPVLSTLSSDDAQPSDLARKLVSQNSEGKKPLAPVKDPVATPSAERRSLFDREAMIEEFIRQRGVSRSVDHGENAPYVSAWKSAGYFIGRSRRPGNWVVGTREMPEASMRALARKLSTWHDL